MKLVIPAIALPAADLIAQLEETIRSFGAWGPVALAVVYIALTLVLVPGWIVAVAAGAIYGIAGGTAIVTVASILSIAMAFLLSRHALRSRVAGWVARSPLLTAVDQALSVDGWKLVALLRLSPFVSFGLQNYVYGATAMRLGPCLAASAAAMLPVTLIYTWIGSVGAEMLAEETTAPALPVLQAIGLIATLVATVFASRLAHRAVRSRLAIEERQ